MLDDALKARYQVDKFLQLQTDFPWFTTGDWSRLSQIHNILSKFNEFTLFVSEKKPQISLAVLIYYELHDLLDEASECKERFINLDEDISLAVKEGMKKYKKYYTFMDASDTYYTALILDPRVKGDLLLEELEDEATRREILQALRDNLHCDYPVNTVESSLPMAQSLQECSTEYSDVESLRRISANCESPCQWKKWDWMFPHMSDRDEHRPRKKHEMRKDRIRMPAMSRPWIFHVRQTSIRNRTNHVIRHPLSDT